MPSPESPVPIVNVGDKGNIALKIDGDTPPQFLTLATPNGLPGIKVDSDGSYTDENGQQWICDEIDLERGKYVQRVENDIITGGFANNGGVSNKIYKAIRALRNSYTSGTCNIISNMFANKKDATAEGITQGYGQIYLKLYIDRLKGEGSTIEDVNAFVKAHPFKVIYKLHAPIEHDLTPEEIAAYKALHTNYPTTVISNDESAHMEVSYVADTKNYIDKKFKELSQVIVNTQIALL